MKTVHVAAGIIRKEGSDELLAVQRGYGDMQGLWEFPGGKLMRGETPEDAVRRELMEELQVKVTNLRDFYTVEYDYPDFHRSPMNPMSPRNTTASLISAGFHAPRLPRWNGCPPTRGSLMR
mgnify:CR=1 FL=1